VGLAVKDCVLVRNVNGKETNGCFKALFRCFGSCILLPEAMEDCGYSGDSRV